MTEFTDCPVDLHYLAENQPSLCIPRVFPNIKEEFIRSTFEKLGLGKIQRIDLISRRTEKGDVFNRAFIHFDKWFWNADAQEARKRLITGKDIKIVYDNPWFWKVSANKWSPRTSDYKGTQLPRMEQLSIAPTLGDMIAPTSNVPAPSALPPRNMRPKKQYKDQRPRFPTMQTQTPPPTPMTPPMMPSNPKTPPGPPPRLPRPEAQPFHPSIPFPSMPIDDLEENEIRCDNNNQENGGLTIDYGDVKLPPAPKIVQRFKNKYKATNAKIPSDPLYDDIVVEK